MSADPRTLEIQTGRKLKIWSSANPSSVVVIQDGSAADDDASLKIDDGFTDGYVPAGSVFPRGIDAVRFRLRTLTSTRTGRRFSFDIIEPSGWNSLGVGAGDRVEFSIDLGEPIAVGGSLPGWHSNSLAAYSNDVVFYGVIESITRSDGEERSFLVQCADAMAMANRIKLVQDLGRGIEIPWLIINCDNPKDPDRVTALKKYSPDNTDLDIKYGCGNALDPTRESLTVGEFLEYLQHTYRASLFERGVIYAEDADLFDADELATLTYTPQKTIFEARGFSDGVRDLIRANLPDHDILVDPRTGVWHIRPVANDLVFGGWATISGTVTPLARFTVDSVDRFAELTGSGSWVRFQSITDRFKTEVRQVVDIDAGALELQVAPPLVYTYASGDLVLPMFDEADRPAILELDADQHSDAMSLEVDLNGVYTAVRVVSRRLTRERVQVSSGEPTDTALVAGGSRPFQARITASYDDEIAEDWNYHSDKTRRSDRGVDGSGIAIDEINVISGVTEIFFSEEESAHGNDHTVPGNNGFRSEWVGTTLHLLTLSGVDVGVAGVKGTVVSFARSGWMDDPTNTIRRFRIILDVDLEEQAPGILDQVHDGDPDRFELTSAEAFRPTNMNKRGAVGRVLTIESTTEADDARWADTQGCPAGLEYPDPLDPTSTVSQSAWPVEQAGQPPRTFDEVKRFFGLQTTPDGNANFNPLTGGVPRAWFLHPRQPDPSTTQPGCAIYSKTTDPPVTMDIDQVTDQFRYVRYPESGFEGMAWLQNGHAEELVLVTDRWQHESQNEQFEQIAQAYHRRLSGLHYTGTVPLVGCMAWVRLLDLGFRVRFGAGNTGFVAGVSTQQAAFWGLLQSVELDLTAGTAELAFESRNVADDLEQDVFEKLFVSETAELKEVQDRLAIVEQQARCLAIRPPDPPPRKIPACDVSVQGQSLARKAVTIDPKNSFLGGGETAIGVPSIFSGNPADTRGSQAFNPQWVVEREALHDRVWAIEVPTGAMYGGALNGSGTVFTPDEDAPAEVVSWPFYAGEAAQEAAAAALGVQIPHPPQPINVALAAGSTQTVIQLRNAIPNDDRFVGGRLELRYAGDRVARPVYEIASHTARTITLTGAMSEPAPLEHLAGTVYGPAVPTLDPTDFPDGGLAVQDAADNWFVLKDGELTAADLVSGVLEAAASPAGPALEIGQNDSSMIAFGAWDFDESPTAPDPVADDELATKGYVDAEIGAAGAGSGLTFGGAMILGALGL